MRLDPFASRYDTPWANQIGAVDVSDLADIKQFTDPVAMAKGRAQQELDKVKADVQRELAALKSQFDPAKFAAGDLSGASGVIANASRAVSDLLRGGAARDPTVDAQLATMGAIIEHPATIAALTGMALIPVIGAPLAGITTAMLAVAGPILDATDALGDAIFHSGESDSARARRKALGAFDGANGVALDAPAPKLGGYAYRTYAMQQFPEASSPEEARRKADALRAARKKFEDSWDGKAAAKAVQKAKANVVETLAPLLGAAAVGDRVASESAKALQKAWEKGANEAAAAAKKAPLGFARNQLTQAAKAMGSWGDLEKEAKKLGTYAAAKAISVQRQIAAAEKAVANWSIPEVMGGLVVNDDGRIESGSWRQERGAPKRLLVTKEGKTAFLRWVKA